MQGSGGALERGRPECTNLTAYCYSTSHLGNGHGHQAKGHHAKGHWAKSCESLPCAMPHAPCPMRHAINVRALSAYCYKRVFHQA